MVNLPDKTGRLQCFFLQQSCFRRARRQRVARNESGAERRALPARISRVVERRTGDVALRAAQRFRDLEAYRAGGDETRCLVGEPRGLESAVREITFEHKKTLRRNSPERFSLRAVTSSRRPRSRSPLRRRLPGLVRPAPTLLPPPRPARRQFLRLPPGPASGRTPDRLR